MSILCCAVAGPQGGLCRAQPSILYATALRDESQVVASQAIGSPDRPIGDPCAREPGNGLGLTPTLKSPGVEMGRRGCQWIATSGRIADNERKYNLEN